MAAREMLVDPGVGSPAAPVGTEDWAKRVRLNLISMAAHVHENPKELCDLLRFFDQKGGWRILTDEHGAFFKSIEEFCACRRNWGLGRPYAELTPYFDAVLGKRGHELFAAKPDLHLAHRVEDTGRFAPSGQVVPTDAAEEKAAKRVRAVGRSPVEIHGLYRGDLIGKVEAAALGPKKQTPETAAKIREAVNEAVAIVDAAKPATPKAKREVKRAVNARVREILGTPTAPATFGGLLDKAAKMSSETRAAFVAELISTLDPIHLHQVREALSAREEL